VEGQRDTAELVAARRGVVRRLLLIGDVAEQVAVLVLRPRQSEVHADAPIDHLHLGLRVRPAVDASKAHEAASVDELVLDAIETDMQGRQWEVVSRDVEHVLALRQRMAQGRVDLGQLCFGQLLRPELFVGHISRCPLALGLEDPWGDGHRLSPFWSA